VTLQVIAIRNTRSKRGNAFIIITIGLEEDLLILDSVETIEKHEAACTGRRMQIVDMRNLY